MADQGHAIDIDRSIPGILLISLLWLCALGYIPWGWFWAMVAIFLSLAAT